MADLYIYHHGILGQKWGVKNGPPYPLKGGDYTKSETSAIRRKRLQPNSIYNKRHFDEVLKADKAKLQTLSYDENRTKNTDMFYASHKTLDNNVYKALLNKPAPKTLYDEKGNVIGTGTMYRKAIKNTLSSDVKVASEDSSAKLFAKLYKKDRDFYNFVTDPNRMEKYFDPNKYKYKGYGEAKVVLDKMKSDTKYTPSSEDLQKVYRIFNFVIPYDGRGGSTGSGSGGKTDSRGASDVYNQRTKFFKELRDAGYGACLDVNDSLYNGLKATSPIIVFDMESVVPAGVKDTHLSDKAVGIMSLSFRKTLGL